jgi:hypothetical protein
MRFLLTAGALLLTGLWASPAGAWTDATRRKMLDDAVKMTPPALATILERYRADLVHGMTDPLRDEAGPDHRQRVGGSYGRAAEMIARHGDQAVTIIGQPGRLRLAVYTLGTAAHYVADVNFPLNCGPGPVGDPVFYADYARYAEKMMRLYPVVLDKKESPELEKNRLADFGKAAALRSSRFVEAIRPAYTVDGKPVSRAAFDEKSIPFGVASLSYSQAVNDIARLWIVLWRRAGGDVDGIPFRPDPEKNGASPKKSGKGK